MIRWSLIVVGLAALGLLKPILNTFDAFEPFAGSWAPVAVTLLVAVVWVRTIVVLRFPHPLSALLTIGALYGLLALGLEELVRRISPEMMPSSLASVGSAEMLVANAAWGAALGVVASAANRFLAWRRTRLLARRFSRSSPTRAIHHLG